MRSIRTLFSIILINLSSLLARDWTDAALNPFPTVIPDHIILNCTADMAHSMAVTWRTDTSIKKAYAEIAKDDASSNFISYVKKYTATTEPFAYTKISANYHSVIFDNLEPNTLYAYRVGSNDNWSEWFQFRTASDKTEPFTFLYLGDGQNALLSLWSRIIRAAYSAAPESRFIIHGGDLVSKGDDYQAWSEWFEAADWINAGTPIVPIIGNHEYFNGDWSKSVFPELWRPQFTLPENGAKELPETNYYFDYQGARFIILNSKGRTESEDQWLESILKDNPCKWTIVAFHHALYSATNKRDYKQLRNAWKPLFDKYRVDLVLQGHDHTYARGHNIDPQTALKEPETGPVYVVSVSGPKFYYSNEDHWMDRAGENTQLYQIVRIDGDSLNYQSFTVTGELYDEFIIRKNGSGPNLFIDKQDDAIPERYFKNTLENPEK